MKKNIFNLILVFCSTGLIAQVNEKLIYESYSPRTQQVVKLGDHFFYIKSDCISFHQECINCQIFKMDQNLNVVDSINFESVVGHNMVEGVTLKKVAEDRIAFPAMDMYSRDRVYLFFIDTALNLIESKSFYTDSFVAVTGYSDLGKKRLLLGGYADFTPYYQVLDSSYNVIGSGEAISSSALAMTAILFKGRILIGMEGGFVHYLILDDSNEIDSVVNRTGPPAIDIYDFIISSDSNYIYGIGNAKYGTPSIVKLDSNFSIVRIDTFTTNSSFPYALNGSHDISKPDSIYMVAGEDAIPSFFTLYPGLKSDIIVYNVDTSGAVNFRVDIGDGKYYLPESIARTEDGGAVIFSFKYDWELPAPSKTVTSIIKIDNQGNVISQKEIPYKGEFLNIYPNPAKDKLHLQGLYDHNNLTAEIYDVGGQRLRSYSLGSERELSVKGLPSGHYLIHVLNKEGDRVVRKFVKE